MNRRRSGGPANVGSVNVYFGPMRAAVGRIDPTRSNTRFVLAGGRRSPLSSLPLLSHRLENFDQDICLYKYIYIYAQRLKHISLRMIWLTRHCLEKFFLTVYMFSILFIHSACSSSQGHAGAHFELLGILYVAEHTSDVGKRAPERAKGLL